MHTDDIPGMPGNSGRVLADLPASSESKSSSSALSREFHNFISDIEEMVEGASSLTGEELTKARAKLRTRVADAKLSVEKMGTAIGDQARKTASDTDQYVHQQPWQAMGIGAAIGLVLGMILARRA